MLVTCLLGASRVRAARCADGWRCRSAPRSRAIAVATASAAGRVGFDSLLQRDGPDAVRGRAFAQFETRFQVAWVVGALFGIIPFGEGVGLLALGLVAAHRRPLVSCGPALRAAHDRSAPTLRPEAVDRVIDKARDELRERYERSKRGRRRAAEEKRKRRSPTRPAATASRLRMRRRSHHRPTGLAAAAPATPPPPVVGPNVERTSRRVPRRELTIQPTNARAGVP